MSSSKTMKRKLRSNDPQTDIKLVGIVSFQITGSKLPSKRQVLQVMFFHMRFGHLSARDSARLVVREMLLFWEKARIPSVSEIRCIEKLENLYNSWKRLNKTGKKQYVKHQHDEQKFIDDLDNLFDIAHINAMDTMKIQEDKEFLKKQREKGRPGCMIGIDKILAAKEKRKSKRNEQEQRYKRKCLESSQNIASIEDYDELISNDSDMDQEIDTLIDSEETNIEIEPQKQSGKWNFITPRLVATLDNSKVSDRFATHILAAVALALGHSLCDLVINRESIRKCREKYREQIFQQIQCDFYETLYDSNRLIVHWDGKLLPEITGHEKVERLPIVVSSSSVEKLLGVPICEDGTGRKIAETVYSTLTEWGLVDRIEGMCFDTTSTNTGIVKGACLFLEKLMGRELAYFACRHHIYEIFLRQAFEIKFGKSKSPNVTLFEEFKKGWNKLDPTKIESCIDDTYLRNKILPDDYKRIIQYSQHQLQQSHYRDDYKEFLELAILFLGGKTLNFKAISRPGSACHARWMAKAIYALKIYLLREQVAFNPGQLNKQKDVCLFIVTIYIEAWFGCTNGVEAANQDLNFIKNVIAYSQTDQLISEGVLEKISHHLWYLSEELIGLAFFDPKVSVEEKKKWL